MKKLIFISGGARSGKSSFAVELARNIGKNIVFVATCVPQDKEMKQRVEMHRKTRPAAWKTIEEPLDLVSALKKIDKSADVVIIDCLTLLISNLMFAGKSEKTIQDEIDRIIQQIKKSNFLTIVASNEVGSGIVPDNRLARKFRDTAGKINQLMAYKSDEAYIMFCGIPLKLKENKNNGKN